MGIDYSCIVDTDLALISTQLNIFSLKWVQVHKYLQIIQARCRTAGASKRVAYAVGVYTTPDSAESYLNHTQILRSHKLHVGLSFALWRTTAAESCESSRLPVRVEDGLNACRRVVVCQEIVQECRWRTVSAAARQLDSVLLQVCTTPPHGAGALPIHLHPFSSQFVAHRAWLIPSFHYEKLNALPLAARRVVIL